MKAVIIDMPPVEEVLRAMSIAGSTLRIGVFLTSKQRELLPLEPTKTLHYFDAEVDSLYWINRDDRRYQIQGKLLPTRGLRCKVSFLYHHSVSWQSYLLFIGEQIVDYS